MHPLPELAYVPLAGRNDFNRIVIDIEPLVVKWNGCSIHPVVHKFAQINVRNDNLRHDENIFGRDPITGERKIRRGDYCCLSKMQAEPFNRQVADSPRHGNVDLILDGTSMAAVANAPETLPIIGAGGNENNVSALFAHHARQLWKLDVVADQDADPAIGRVEHIQVVAWVTFPLFSFPAGQVNLVLGKYFAFWGKKVGRVR